MEIIIANLFTIIFLIGTIIILILKLNSGKKISFYQYQLIFSFIFLIVGTASDSLYHLGYGSTFDTYGEYINLLFFPMTIFSFFTFTLNKELEKRKESERQLQLQNEALLKSNTELDSFVYRVSHDLRSPICTAMGLINLSKKSDSIQEVQQYLLLQENGLKRLDQFIINILDYSKNIHTSVAPEKIDFDSLIDTALSDYQSENKNQIRVIKNFMLDYPFSNDLVRVKIIINNLISNAIKFQRPNEENPFIEINIRTNISNAIITIRDNGIGIHDDFKKDIYKMFFRANSTNTGSGLGLYIVHDSIQKLNAKIDFTSINNQGTTFTIDIPNLY
ncbi:MAG: HAMP domain-containing sensor histidine kinase [Cytophagaceae bacterium]